MEHNGTNIELNGTQMEPNGTQLGPNETQMESNGTQMDANGAQMEPNGTQIVPNGTQMEPKWCPIGSVQAPLMGIAARRDYKHLTCGRPRPHGKGSFAPRRILYFEFKLTGVKIYSRR